MAGMAMEALTSTRSTLPSRGVVFGVYKHVSHRVRVNALVAIPASTSALASRYEALTTLSLSVAISLASLVILFTPYPVTDAPTFFTLVKLGGASGVVLANTHVVSATTLLGSLWLNVPRVTVVQISGCGVCSYAMGKTSSTSSVK